MSIQVYDLVVYLPDSDTKIVDARVFVQNEEELMDFKERIVMVFLTLIRTGMITKDIEIENLAEFVTQMVGVMGSYKNNTITLSARKDKTIDDIVQSTPVKEEDYDEEDKFRIKSLEAKDSTVESLFS